MATYFTEDSSFDGTEFMEDFSSGTSGAEPDVLAKYTVHGIPGSNDKVRNSTGVITPPGEIPILCTRSELTALQGKVDSTGTLIYHSGSIGSVYLAGVVGAVKESGADIYRARLKFEYD